MLCIPLGIHHEKYPGLSLAISGPLCSDSGGEFTSGELYRKDENQIFQQYFESYDVTAGLLVDYCLLAVRAATLEVTLHSFSLFFFRLFPIYVQILILILLLSLTLCAKYLLWGLPGPAGQQHCRWPQGPVLLGPSSPAPHPPPLPACNTEAAGNRHSSQLFKDWYAEPILQQLCRVYFASGTNQVTVVRAGDTVLTSLFGYWTKVQRARMV